MTVTTQTHGTADMFFYFKLQNLYKSSNLSLHIQNYIFFSDHVTVLLSIQKISKWW